MVRELRHPADTSEFNRLALAPLVKRLTASWWNLRWLEHHQPGRLFFATASGRLTPASLKVPCLYLAQNRETSFREIYGDMVDAAQKCHQAPLFSRREMQDRVYLKTTAPVSVKVYDLSAGRSAKRIGLDLATLYTPDVSYPREFAQRLHDHPAKFDGIQYVSRHTQSLCVVLWATHTPALRTLATERGPSLWDLVSVDRSSPASRLKLFDTFIQVAATP